MTGELDRQLIYLVTDTFLASVVIDQVGTSVNDRRMNDRNHHKQVGGRAEVELCDWHPSQRITRWTSIWTMSIDKYATSSVRMYRVSPPVIFSGRRPRRGNAAATQQIGPQLLER